jgi:hypothetical protein
MLRLIDKLRQRLWTRRCKGCDDLSPHTHHLTFMGKRRFT